MKVYTSYFFVFSGDYYRFVNINYSVILKINNKSFGLIFGYNRNTLIVLKHVEKPCLTLIF